MPTRRPGITACSQNASALKSNKPFMSACSRQRIENLDFGERVCLCARFVDLDVVTLEPVIVVDQLTEFVNPFRNGLRGGLAVRNVVPDAEMASMLPVLSAADSFPMATCKIF